MTNLENISYYEKLHDLFEHVNPKDLPKKIGYLIEYIEQAGEHHNVSVSDVTSILLDMQSAFERSLKPMERAFLLTNQSRNYQVNIYPIIDFLKDNPTLDGELDQLKTRLVTLAHSNNVSQLKDIYTLVDLVSITFEE